MPATNDLAYPLVLLVGMPRSGTTWLGKIFDSHPSIDYRHEPDSVQRLNKVPLVVEPDDYPMYENAVESYMNHLPRTISLKVLGKTPIFAKRYMSLPRLWLFRGNLLAARLGARMAWHVPIVHPLRDYHSTDVKLAWKSIESVARIGLIMHTAPAILAILILRHPCGQIASVLHGEAKGRFSALEASSEDYGYFEQFLSTESAHNHGLTLDKLGTLHPVERLAWRWVLANENAISQVAANDRVKVVRYEDLCDAPIDCSKMLFNFCGLDWCDSAANFVRSSTESENETYYSVFKISRSTANKWRNSLGDENIKKILAILAKSKLAAYYPELPPKGE